LTDKRRRVLVVNTGGTIMMVRDGDNPRAPWRPGDYARVTRDYPALSALPFKLVFHSFDPLIDSSDMTDAGWRETAGVIGRHYDSIDGAVVLHGTDTMCYTAAALSFLLENLAKPVVLTGAQLPLIVPRSDGLQNFVTALCIAAGLDVSDGSALPPLPEVCVYFGGKLLRGNRARKLSASAYAGFESPNFPPLGTVGKRIELDTKRIAPLPDGPFRAGSALDTRVMTLDLFPGFDPDLFQTLVTHEAADGTRVRGLVLKTFGAGNAPTNRRFLEALALIRDRGIPVVNVSQCPQGEVELGLYEASAGMQEAGVIGGLDLTPEAALCKLMWLLGRGLNRDEIAREMERSHRGERSPRPD